MLQLSGAEKMKDDPEDSAYSTHECESKEQNVDANDGAGSTVWLKVFKFTLLLSDKQTLATTGLPLTDT